MPGYRFGTLRTPYRTVAATRKFLERLPERDLLVGAFLGERLVGAAGLHRSEGRRSHAALLVVGVADDVGGRGAGPPLAQPLTDPADNGLDTRRIELTVYHDNDTAIRLYERFGFEHEGVHRAASLREGKYVDVVAMARLRGI